MSPDFTAISLVAYPMSFGVAALMELPLRVNVNHARSIIAEPAPIGPALMRAMAVVHVNRSAVRFAAARNHLQVFLIEILKGALCRFGPGVQLLCRVCRLGDDLLCGELEAQLACELDIGLDCLLIVCGAGGADSCNFSR